MRGDNVQRFFDVVGMTPHLDFVEAPELTPPPVYSGRAAIVRTLSSSSSSATVPSASTVTSMPATGEIGRRRPAASVERSAEPRTCPDVGRHRPDGHRDGGG